MRSETLFLWGSTADPIELEPNVLDSRIEGHCPLSTQRGDRYVVEFCWVENGVVRCRTVQVRAATETLAVSIACQRARKTLRKVANEIEVVDIERIAQPSRQED